MTSSGGNDNNDEYLFAVVKVVVFRGTDYLKFDLIMVTRDLKCDKADIRTKVFDHIATEHDQKGEYVNFWKHKHWIGASMTTSLEMTLKAF